MHESAGAGRGGAVLFGPIRTLVSTQKEINCIVLSRGPLVLVFSMGVFSNLSQELFAQVLDAMALFLIVAEGHVSKCHRLL